MSSDEYDNYTIRKFENSCPEIGAGSDVVYLLKPCPKCAEKDAEIARLAESIRHASADCFRIQKERDELKTEIAKVHGDSAAWNKSFHEANEERKELKAKLETARKALIKLFSGRRSWTEENAIIQEALKQIGE